MSELFGYEYDDGGRGKYFPKKAGGDCVCRAIAIVAGMDYMKVYNMLKENMKCNPDRGINCNDRRFRKLMDRLGFRYGVAPGRAAILRAGELPSKGRYVCLTKRHAIAVIDGVVHDTFDSRFSYSLFGKRVKERTIYGYFKYDTNLR